MLVGVGTEELSPRDVSSGPVTATIIIPTYNAADTLERAVRSALAQTAGGTEIHIVDDASTDGSWALITALWSAHSNIAASRLAQNVGRALAANHASDRARGTWIAILDADDWYEPTRIARIIAAAESAGVELGADNQFIVDPGTLGVVGTGVPVGAAPVILDLDSFQANSDATRSFDVGMLKPVFRRDFSEAHRIGYFGPARRGQDYYFLLEFFAAGGRAVVIDTPLYHYVQPFGTVSRQWSSQGRKRYPFEAMKQVNDHFLTTLAPRLTPLQRSRLAARGRQFATMAAFHQLREATAEGSVARAGGILLRGFPDLWWRLVRVTLGRYLGRPPGAPAIRRLRPAAAGSRGS